MKSYFDDAGRRVADFSVSLGGRELFRLSVPVSDTEPSTLQARAMLGKMDFGMGLKKTPSPDVPDFSKMEAWHAEAAKRTPGFMPEKRLAKGNPRHPVGATFSMLDIPYESRDEGCVEVNSFVCRRRDDAGFNVLPSRRVRDVLLTVETVVSRFGASGRSVVGFYCRDYEQKLHYLKASEVRRFSV
jgi:hypothetical protein